MKLSSRKWISNGMALTVKAFGFALLLSHLRPRLGAARSGDGSWPGDECDVAALGWASDYRRS